MREIRYRPRNVRETLVELKNTSELAVDLAYSALLSDDAELAQEVIDLERRVEYLEYQARIALMLATGRVDEAERMVGVFKVVDTAVGVTHAAGDIARILTKGVGRPEALRGALPEAPEAVVRATVSPTSPYAGRTLADLDVHVETGVRVVALRREDEWRIGPGSSTKIVAGDVLIGSGPDAGVEEFYEAATGEPLTPPAAEPSIDGLNVAVDLIVRLKTLSEVSVGLAYSAALFDNEDVAAEVRTLETRSDELKAELETWVIDAIPEADKPQNLRGLLHLAAAAEETCDAALVLANAVLRNVELHPVFGEAIKDSAEVITTVTLSTDASIVGDDVADLELEARTGMVVLAVRRDGEWIFDPEAGTELEAGDALIVRGPRKGEPRLQELAGGSSQ